MCGRLIPLFLEAIQFDSNSAKIQLLIRPYICIRLNFSHSNLFIVRNFCLSEIRLLIQSTGKGKKEIIEKWNELIQLKIWSWMFWIFIKFESIWNSRNLMITGNFGLHFSLLRKRRHWNIISFAELSSRFFKFLLPIVLMTYLRPLNTEINITVGFSKSINKFSVQ